MVHMLQKCDFASVERTKYTQHHQHLTFQSVRGHKALVNFHKLACIEVTNFNTEPTIPTPCHWIGSSTLELISKVPFKLYCYHLNSEREYFPQGKS